TVVSSGNLEALRGIARELGAQPRGDADSVTLFGRRFVAGDQPGTRTEPNKSDVEGMARVVRSAAAMADATIVSIHAHEGGNDRTRPADFLVAFAHAMIDAGADIVVRHGPHAGRGIEIYKGKASFYSRG